MNFQRLYFDRLYTPLYDATVANITPYERLQRQALEGVLLSQGASVLCVGVGTGKEMRRLADLHPSVAARWVGVDLVQSSLTRLRKNTAGIQNLATALMDAQSLAFRSETFDVIVCLHTMDFLENPSGATQEIVRLLKPGGQLVVSYPTGKGGLGLISEVSSSVKKKLRTGNIASGVQELGAAVGAALAYLPLAVSVRKPKGGYLTREGLLELMQQLGVKELYVEENLSYQDLLVFGRR